MENLKMLIVEDNNDTAEVEVSTFESLGFIVNRVTNGDEAIPKMREFVPNIVILDLELPGKKGHEITLEMSKEPILKDIPVIVYSVHMANFATSEGLDTKYFWAQYQKSGNREPRVIKKESDENSLLNLAHEVFVACDQTYGVVPRQLQEFLDKKMPD